MNKKHLQSISRWGKKAIKIAASGKMESAHIDEMFLGKSYSKKTAVEDCLSAMDYLVESFAEELCLRKIIIMASIRLKYRNHLSTDLPNIQRLAKEIESPPEIMIMPYMYYMKGIGISKKIESYTEDVVITSPNSLNYDATKLFSYYYCWRGEEAIDNKWMEYERCIYRVYDPIGRIYERSQ